MYLLKNILFLCLISAITSFILVSCDKVYSTYLSSEVGLPENHLLVATKDQILSQRDSIEKLLPRCGVHRSMIYHQGDYSFQITRFSYKGKAVLYLEQGNSGDYGSTWKRCYIKDGQLAFVDETSIIRPGIKPYSNLRMFYRDGLLVGAERKVASTKSELQQQAFIDIDVHQPAPAVQVGFCEDALNQRNRFDLVFDGIAESPKARYLVLTRNEINAYRATLRVERGDEFIQEISSNPARYRGEKLDLNWRINESNEAVYATGKLKTRN